MVMDRSCLSRCLVVVFVVFSSVVLIAIGSGCGGDADRPSAPVDLMPAGEAPAKGFDVVVITLDTTRADRLGCYGNKSGLTPNIDALAKDGVLFTHATTPVPMTLPSHASYLTGLVPPNHGARLNGTYRLDDGHRTLAELFKDTNYATGAVIAAFVLDERFGLAQGFDHYEDDIDPRAQFRGHFAERDATRVTDAAVAWLDGVTAKDDRPYFLWAHYFDPHQPYEPPAEFALRFADALYDGEIAYMDAAVGRLLDHVKSKGRFDRTLVVVTADHGEGLGEHGENTHAFLCYESTMAVPMIVSNPKLFAGGHRVDDRVVGLVDILPTLAELCGLPVPPKIDGTNMLRPLPADRAIYIESVNPRFNHGWASLHGLRRRDDKLIWGPDPEYYDLTNDPDELRSLYAGSDEALDLEEMLKKQLGQWEPLDDVEAAAPEIDPEVARRLATLGYMRTKPSGVIGGRADPKRMLPLHDKYQLAAELARRKKPQAALKHIDWCLKGDPTNGKYWFTAAEVYRQLGRAEDAEACYRQSLRYLEQSHGYVSLAILLFERGERDEAFTLWKKAEEIAPQDGSIFMARGTALARIEDFDGAIRNFERAVEIDPIGCAVRGKEQLAKARTALAAKQ